MAPLPGVFSISCQHPYFTGGVCLALSLAPTAACRALMRQYGLRFLPAAGGGSMYYTDAARLAAFAAPLPLDFIVSSNDPDLINYSAIDQSSVHARTLFYADNLQHAAAQLRPDFAASALATRPSGFSISLPQPLAAASLVLLDALGQVAWQGTSPTLPQAHLDVVLSGVPSGRYALLANAVPLLDFYLQAQPGPRPFGVLAIYPGGPRQAPWMPGACPAIGADGRALNPQYTFALAPRAPRWRYHIHSQHLNLGNWQLQACAPAGGTPPSGAPVFTCTNPQAQQPPWTFESRQGLALAQAPATWHFMLTRPPSAGRGTRSGGPKIRLPYASGAALVQVDDDPLGGLSDIFVYL